MSERVCQRPGCGRPIPSRKRQDARWCSRSCEGKARRAASRKARFEAANPDVYSNYAGATRVGSGIPLAELHQHARSPQDWTDDPRAFSDFGDVPGDFELAAQIDAEDEQGPYPGDVEHVADERARRFHGMVQADEARRTPRRSWFDLKKFYNTNSGVELPGITDERVQRHKADRAAIQARLENNTGQPQDRFRDATKDVVGTKGTESRRLNHARAVADPRPVSQRQEFSFQAEQIDGGPHHYSRPSGPRPGHSDYAWNMEDGFRF